MWCDNVHSSLWKYVKNIINTAPPFNGEDDY